MMSSEIPKTNFAIIGGSSTLSINFPEDVDPEVKVIASDLIFQTPYGESPKFKLLEINAKKILLCKMHGWRPGVPRRDASLQIFWVFYKAGVKSIIAEGGVGSINHLLKPRDLVIPNDYIDHSMRKDVTLDLGYLSIMRNPVCPHTSKILYETALKNTDANVFSRGNYVVTDGKHFESVAEVHSFKLMSGDIIGQSMCPEVYLSREIGACYGRVDMVVNYAEGIICDWEHAELKDIFYNESVRIGSIVLTTMIQLTQEVETSRCECKDLRKKTLLKID
ncbi:MTAP family purine nucleoside phosphorylase [Desulfitispora alkaliphila]|uniref:MTAP family purine nucleoside phosphorylase n=1 Tax=Desulfitispora alkaliphila TaxID=622674 RepID=UPI003D245EDE